MANTRQERHDIAFRHLAPLTDRHHSLAGARVVEFGCGSGPVAEAFARHGASVLGVEILEADVLAGRALLKATPELDVELFAGDFEALLRRVREETGAVEVVTFPAVLEHMTHDERIASLRVAREVLKPDGVIAIFESPNRVLPMDYHTTTAPFFHLLPDDLALEWVDRTPRRDVVQQLADADADDRLLTLRRLGRAMSFHELDVAWPDGYTTLGGGFDPLLIPARRVYQEERVVAGWMEQMTPDVHPAFARYWIDVVVRPGSSAAPDHVWRPLAFDAVGVADVGITRWGMLTFRAPEAFVSVWSDRPFDAISIGVEGDPDREQAVVLRTPDGAVHRTEAPAEPATHYDLMELPEPSSMVLVVAKTPHTTISHIAARTSDANAP